MDLQRFQQISGRFANLRVAVLGDFCLDRYLEIDPARAETSIETGLPVYNVARVRAQPGAAGTILNNLAALGVGTLYPIGFAGFDGEGYELVQALEALPGVKLHYFLRTEHRRTFTYCKPLVLEPGKPPRELNRLDTKNWSATPPQVERALVSRLQAAAREIDAVMVLDQVDLADTGVVTGPLLHALGAVARGTGLPILADSRRGLGDFPPVAFKMNAAELGRLMPGRPLGKIDAIKSAAAELARRNRQPVFVTLSEKGILAAGPDGQIHHRPTLPVRGPIDIVGAGDAVSANLVAALAAGAGLDEAIDLANAAASVAIHKLGTTGTATPAEIGALLFQK